MCILVLNGPNLNLLGVREPGLYGTVDYDGLLALIQKECDALGVEVRFCQSNHEGDLVDWIQAAYGVYDGIVLNPGAYTHTSIALLDALLAVGIPTVEVHLSDLKTREPFRQISYIRPACAATFMGLGIEGYRRGMEFLEGKIRQEPHT